MEAPPTVPPTPETPKPRIVSQRRDPFPAGPAARLLAEPPKDEVGDALRVTNRVVQSLKATEVSDPEIHGTVSQRLHHGMKVFQVPFVGIRLGAHRLLGQNRCRADPNARPNAMR